MWCSLRKGLAPVVLGVLYVVSCPGCRHAEAEISQIPAGSVTCQVIASSQKFDDGTPYADLELVAQKTGPASFTAHSDVFPPHVIVERVARDGTSEVISETDAKGSTADASFSAEMGGLYRLLICNGRDAKIGPVTVNLQPQFQVAYTGEKAL